MVKRIFQGFIDHVDETTIYAAGENDTGQPVLLDLPLAKWPLGKPRAVGTIFFIEVNGAFTDITFPASEVEIPSVKLNLGQQFVLWLTNLFK